MALPGLLLEGKYEMLAKIREGGMGAIYKVHHRLLDEVRVIKVMKPQLGDDPELKKRFALEAKTITRLKHPNIATINDFAIDPDGTAFIVMEYIDGANLEEILRYAGPLPLALALEITHQTLAALDYLHGKRVVHRDIAPDNIMLTVDEKGRPLVKLIDLGIAKALDSTTAVTSTGIFLGKLKYSSPEQLGALSQGESLDGRSDQYSLGVVLYELLTAQRPIPGDTTQELIASHLFKPPVPFANSDPKGLVPPELRAVVMQTLAKNRQDRFASAAELDRQIQAVQAKIGAADLQTQAKGVLSAVRRRSDGAPTAAQHVTPSVQDRVDRHFQPQVTPLPAGYMTQSETFVAPTPSPSATPSRPTRLGEESARESAPDMPTRRLSAVTEGLTRPAGRRRSGWVVAGILVIALGGVALLLRNRFLQGERGGASAVKSGMAESTSPSAMTEPSKSLASTPTPAAATPSAPALEPPPAASPATATPAPVESAKKEPPAKALQVREGKTAESERRAALRREQESVRPSRPSRPEAPPAPDPAQVGAVQARYAAEVARRRADDAGAKELAGEIYGRGAALQSDGQEHLGRKEYADASSALEQAAKLFTQAEISARSEAARRSAAAKSAEASRAEPPPAAHVAPPPTDQQKIREVIARYERAQNTLDAALYIQVRPSLASDRQQLEQAFADLKSQHLSVDISGIQVAGDNAVVRAHEIRDYTPRVGSEGHSERSIVIRLQKRGDEWIITRLD